MSLPLFKVWKRFLLVPNHETHSQVESIVIARKLIMNKGEEGRRFGLDSFQQQAVSYQVVPACVMNHPAFFHHRGAPPLGVFNGLDHPHQRDVAACGGAARAQTHTQTNTHRGQRVNQPVNTTQQVDLTVHTMTTCPCFSMNSAIIKSLHVCSALGIIKILLQVYKKSFSKGLISTNQFP